MNIIILGLPGTGKTTLCKNISEMYNLKYVSDYNILSKYGYRFESSLKIIDNDFSGVISTYFQNFKPQNCIFDFNYCIIPEDIVKIYDFSNSVVLYLGFYGSSKNELLSRFETKYPNIAKTELESIINMFLEVSEKYKILCNKFDIDFVSINQEKNVILKKLQNEISAILEDR